MSRIFKDSIEVKKEGNELVISMPEGKSWRWFTTGIKEGLELMGELEKALKEEPEKEEPEKEEQKIMVVHEKTGLICFIDEDKVNDSDFMTLSFDEVTE